MGLTPCLQGTGTHCRQGAQVLGLLGITLAASPAGGALHCGSLCCRLENSPSPGVP